MRVLGPARARHVHGRERAQSTATRWFSDPEARPPTLDARHPHHPGRRRKTAVATSAPREPPVVRPVYRVWWAWAVLGSVGVVLASITFVRLRRARRSPRPPRPGSSTVRPAERPDRRRSSPGRCVDIGVGWRFAHDPVGDYAGQANRFGVAAFGLPTGTMPSFGPDFLDKTDGWAAWRSHQRQGLESDPLPPRARGAHSARGGYVGRGPRALTTSTSRSSGRTS